jgi:hypothetical protein
MGQICEGSGHKIYDGLPKAWKGKMKCHICGKSRKPYMYMRSPRHESWSMPVFTMPEHERTGIIERYCPNPDCGAKLALDLNKIERNVRCGHCHFIFFFAQAGEKPCERQHAEIMRTIIKAEGGRL